MGLPADPGRAAETEPPGLGDNGTDNRAPPRPGPRSAPSRPHVDRGPAVTGGRYPGLRFLHRRHAPAQDVLRALLLRALDPPSARRRGHGTPRLGLGHPTGQEPFHRGAAWRCSVPLLATETPSSRVRSTRCFAPRGPGSSEHRSGPRGPTRSRSDSCGPSAESAWTTSWSTVVGTSNGCSAPT